LRLTAKDAPLFVSCDGRRIQPQFVADTVKDTVICVAPSHSASAYSGHSLRHGGLTALSLAGAPDMLVQKIARHKDPRSTEKYIRPSLSSLREAYMHL
jgi:site-specific recombinase XerD